MIAAVTRVDLASLVSALSHPTRIVRGVLEGRDFRLSVIGYPWWRRDATLGSEGAIELIFEGVSGGSLDLPLTYDSDDDEQLEPFAVTPLADLAWAQPSSLSVYCSAPLTDPMRFYRLLADYLGSVGAPTTAAQYLNHGASPDRFVAFATSASYLLSTASPPITRLITDELAAQGVPYTVQGAEPAVDSRLWVRLGDANFYCDRAFAEFGA